MEKFGCDRMLNIDLRIQELEEKTEKTASDSSELLNLYKLKKELEAQSA